MACTGDENRREIIAQCRLKAFEPAGINFRREFFSWEEEQSEKDYDAFSGFVMLCMESKGYKFVERFSEDGTLNTPCWSQSANRANAAAHHSDAECYSPI
jgi:hypothetical protein